MTQEVNDRLINNGNLHGNRYSRFLSEQTHETISTVQTPVIKYSLPTVENPQRESSSFRSISATVLSALLRSRHLQFIIFDCRYPFEFFGGHIKGAINIYTLDDLEQYFFDEYGLKSTLVGLMPIFYCEYSQVRGPAMARRLRSIDIHKSKVLEFPEIYLLDKGYVNFWSDPERRDLCEPQHYISMHSKPYRHALRQYTQHRSKSTAEGRKNKKNHLRVFSTTHLLEETNEEVKEEQIEVVRISRARTPRTRLNFE